MLSAQGSPSVRILSVIAATIIALASGTNYVYSAWAPQFAQRLNLSATESNLVGTMGNLGMYMSGVPLGMMIDTKGPKMGVAVCIILLGAGYYPIAKAFDAGPDVFPVPALCLFSFLTGAGSYAGFGAAVKVVAVNFPDSRGTATAFPVAAFGLSASAFATAALALPHDTAHFLLLLATGTVVLPLLSFPFLRIAKPQDYNTIPQYDDAYIRRNSSVVSSQIIPLPGTAAQDGPPGPNPSLQRHTPRNEHYDTGDDDDAASLFSTDSSEAMAGLEAIKSMDTDKTSGSRDVDIKGFTLLRRMEFWQLFVLLGLLAGTGLMTINNIGNDVQALWRHYDANVTDGFIAKRQVAHVSTISLCSFAGRLSSGIFSDILVIKYNRSRLWCIVVSTMLFSAAQLLGVLITLPDLLVLVAGLNGLGYGILFGVYPSIVAHAFGISGFSQNWGTICLAPAIFGNIFNVLYGRIFDSHSIVQKDGTRRCLEGRDCYSKAYLATWSSCLLAILLCGWAIFHENRTFTKRHHERTP